MKTLIINGHPNKESFNYGIHEAYKEGAVYSGKEIEEIFIGELDFNPSLEGGFMHRTELE